jgi:hypothetical protein
LGYTNTVLILDFDSDPTNLMSILLDMQHSAHIDWFEKLTSDLMTDERVQQVRY